MQFQFFVPGSAVQQLVRLLWSLAAVSGSPAPVLMEQGLVSRSLTMLEFSSKVPTMNLPTYG